MVTLVSVGERNITVAGDGRNRLARVASGRDGNNGVEMTGQNAIMNALLDRILQRNNPRLIHFVIC